MTALSATPAEGRSRKRSERGCRSGRLWRRMPERMQRGGNDALCGQWRRDLFRRAIERPSACPSSCVNDVCSTEPPSCVSPVARNEQLRSQDGVSCCASPIVTAVTYSRSYDGVGFTDATDPATVTAFRFDQYEATVGSSGSSSPPSSRGGSPRPGPGSTPT